MTELSDAMVDLSDVQTFRAGFPHEAFTRLRRHDPVHWHEPTATTPDGEGFWVLSRYADVMTVLRDPTTFSSDRGGVRERGGTGLKDEGTAGTMLNMTDGAQHDRLRSLVNRGFTPRAVSALESDLHRRTAHLLETVGDRPFDAVRELARELPAQAICVVLGVPDADRPQLLDWLDAGIEAGSASIVSPEATHHIRRYAEQLISDKRAHPDGGIMSTIVHARMGEDGGPLTDRELTAFFALLFPAGAETTRSAIAGGIKAFAEHPDQFARIRRDPDVIVTAIEEIVRWSTPSIYKRRTASRDVELSGRLIRAGEKVTVWEMSANRDESVFESPFTFDVGRLPNPHVGFGFGIHFCLGASLARLELRVVLQELAKRYERFELTGDHEWMPNNRLFGLKHLPVRGHSPAAMS